MRLSPKVNIQQLPKVERVLRCLRPPPGWALVDTDFNAIEPKVIAEFSRDPTYHELYATGRPHDVYLYVAAALFDDATRARIDEVYNLANPTPESVDAAKVRFKRERKLAKVIHLAAGYGASARKMHQTMRIGGIAVSIAEVVEMRAAYWRLFGGVKRWEQELLHEHEDRGGWIYNGHNRPLAIPPDYTKDICNRFVQSTGHDCLLIYLHHLDRLRRERRVPMRPWIPDFHDETVWLVPESAVDAAVAAMVQAYKDLNAELQPSIPIVGNVDICQTLWDAKKG